MRQESLRSYAPGRVPPWLPDLRFGKPVGCFGPAPGRMALVTGLVAHDVAVGVERLDCCFAWRGYGAVVGGLWTASGLIAFALVVSGWLVAVF